MKLNWFILDTFNIKGLWKKFSLSYNEEFFLKVYLNYLYDLLRWSNYSDIAWIIQ